KDRRDRLVYRLPVGANNNLRVFRWFIRRVDAGEFANLSGARFFVEIFWIARFANFQRRIDEHFDELSISFERDFARTSSIHSIWRNESGDRDQTGIRH